MAEDDRIGRRRFTEQSLLALLGGVSITISGCGGGGGGGGGNSGGGVTSPTAPSPGDAVGIVGTNHGHTAVVEASDLAAGVAIILDIRGTSDHPHTVDLTGADIQAIAAGNRVQKLSSNDDAHTHTVTFN